MVGMALEAAKMLEEEGISARVINIHTIKPIDEEIITKAAKETGAIVTAEEHYIMVLEVPLRKWYVQMLLYLLRLSVLTDSVNRVNRLNYLRNTV